ncbi:MAG: CsbD family protein [Burkholderiales bacterium]|nr:CsbD family protein [Burkholderiales bacterium]
MNKQQVKGLANRAAGEIKEQVGKITRNRSLEARGHAQEAKGKVQSRYGNVKEDVKQDQREMFADKELASKSRSGKGEW